MANPQALLDLPSLYDHTGNIRDINTLLITASAYYALAARATAAPVPKGWKLVPIEPTDAMAVAAVGASLHDPAPINGLPQWRAMLAASPKGPL